MGSKRKASAEELFAPSPKRKHLSIPQKLDIIEKVDDGVSVEEIAKDLNISKETVNIIYSSKSKFTAFEWSGIKNAKSTREVLDSKVYSWFRHQRSRGKIVRGVALTRRATLLSKKLGLTGRFTDVQEWLERFTKKYKIELKLQIKRLPQNILDRLVATENFMKIPSDLEINESSDLGLGGISVTEDSEDVEEPSRHSLSSCDDTLVKEEVEVKEEPVSDFDIADLNLGPVNDEYYPSNPEIEGSVFLMPVDKMEKKRMVSCQKKLVENEQESESLSEKFGTSLRTVHYIRSSSARCKMFMYDFCSKMRLRAARQACLKELNAYMVKWILEKQHQGEELSWNIVLEKAKLVYKELGGEGEFHGSVGWLHRFKKRHNFTWIKHRGKKVNESGDGDESGGGGEVSSFPRKVKKLIQMHKLTPEQVYSCNRTAFPWRGVQTDGNNQDLPDFKRSKERISVVFCANASGNHKLKPLVIGRSKKPRAFKNMTNLPVTYKNDKTLLMNTAMFDSWFQHEAVPAIKHHLKSQKLEENAIIIMEDDPSNGVCFPSRQKSICGNVQIVFWPASAGDLSQPLKQRIIDIFKVNYYQKLQCHLNKDKGLTGESYWSLTMKDAVYITEEAWNDISPSTIQMSWTKIWPAVIDNQFQGFEDSSSPALESLKEIVCTLMGVSAWNNEHSDTQKNLSDVVLLKSVKQEKEQESYEGEHNEIKLTNCKKSQKICRTFVKVVQDLKNLKMLPWHEQIALVKIAEKLTKKRL